jgi:hypothetical protein
MVAFAHDTANSLWSSLYKQEVGRSVVNTCLVRLQVTTAAQQAEVSEQNCSGYSGLLTIYSLTGFETACASFRVGSRLCRVTGLGVPVVKSGIAGGAEGCL